MKKIIAAFLALGLAQIAGANGVCFDPATRIKGSIVFIRPCAIDPVTPSCLCVDMTPGVTQVMLADGGSTTFNIDMLKSYVFTVDIDSITVTAAPLAP